MLGTQRHKTTKTTHNPIAFAKSTKPPSASTHGELRPDMITCFKSTPGEKRVCDERSWIY